MDNFNEKLQNRLERLDEKMKREHKDFMDKLKSDADELDQKSINNFNEWREFLYKYFVFITTIIVGSGFLQKFGEIESKYFKWGILLGLIGIVVGFLGINIYFYFERKRLQIEHYITTSNPYKLFDHPDCEENNIKKAIKLNLNEKISEYEKEIIKLSEDKINNKHKIKKFNDLIKGDKNTIKLMKYFGGMFGLIEKTWFCIVFVSVVSSLVGIILILKGLI